MELTKFMDMTLTFYRAVELHCLAMSRHKSSLEVFIYGPGECYCHSPMCVSGISNLP